MTAAIARRPIPPLFARNRMVNLGLETLEDPIANRADWLTIRDFDLEDRVPICIGGGPSLDVNGSALLGADRSRFAILATGTALRWLLRHGIRPDAACSTEQEGRWNLGPDDRRNADLHLDEIEEACTMPLFAPYQCSQSFVERWSGPVLWFADVGWKYRWLCQERREIYPMDAVPVEPRFPTVGGALVAIAAELQGHRRLEEMEVVLVGYDFTAYRTGPGRYQHHHSEYPELSWTDQDYATGFDDHWRLFRDRYGCDWGVPVTNCTEGGRLPQDMTLRERLERG